MHGFGRIRQYSSGSETSDQDYGYAHSVDIVAPEDQDKCHRCGKKVYQTEKIEVGVLLHRYCFRCHVCDLTLSMTNFILGRPDENSKKQVYCKIHAPRPEAHTLDPEAVDIKHAVNAQKATRALGLTNQVRLLDSQGWEYDPNAVEFGHHRHITDQNRRQRPPNYDAVADPIEYERGDMWKRLEQGELERESVRHIASHLVYHRDGSGRRFPPNSDYMEPNALWSPAHVDNPYPNDCGFHSAKGHELADTYYNDPHHEMQVGNGRRQQYSEERIYESLCPVRDPAHPPSSSMGPGGNKAKFNAVLQDLHKTQAFQMRSGERHTREGRGYDRPDFDERSRYEYDRRRHDFYQAARERHDVQKVPQRPNKEYLHEKAFIRQNELELKQRHEHGELFRQFEKLRIEQTRSLEEEMKLQLERAVQDLFKRMENGNFDGDIEVEKLNIEQEFMRLKEQKSRHLMEQLTSQERMRIDDMIDKQTQEMLQLLDKKALNKLPPPCPPRFRKSQLYAGPQVFDDLDFQAIQVAQKEQSSFTELVYELTRNCRSQLEKARTIFRWITVKDLNNMIFREELKEDSPYYFLQGIKYGLESYHELFKRLCSYVGLPVKIVRGYSKSAGYKPGMTFGDNRFRNSWTVVFIDGYWRFIDCHWGARHVSSARDMEDPFSFHYEVDEFFFLTDPDDHICMHYPDDAEWQLLDQTLTIEQFINMPVVKSHFFHYGLKFGSKLWSVIENDNGKVEIVLRKTSDTPLAFNTRLEQNEDVIDGYSIYHCSGEEVVFNITLPGRGVFFFTIFSCDTDKSDAYNNVCSFRIKCSKVETKPFCKLPRLPDGYGLTYLGTELGLSTEKYNEYYLVTNEDKMILNIKFQRSVNVSHKLMFGYEAIELDRYAFQRFRDNAFVSYLIRFPQRGLYVFSIFAAKQDSGKTHLSCACRYLIQCNAKPSGSTKIYPKTQQYWKRCRLHEPTQGELKLNKNVKFKVEVPSADAVAVIINTQWFYLKRGTGDKVWEGIAHTGNDKNVTADVYVKYEGRDFFPLLEYKLVSET